VETTTPTKILVIRKLKII